MDSPPLTEEYIKGEFEKYVNDSIGPKPINVIVFGESVIAKYMITVYNFGPLGEKIRSGQAEIMRLLKLLYNYWITTHDDDDLFVGLVKEIFVTASTIDKYGPVSSRYKRFIPEDTIYFHLLATIHLNIESLVETYSHLDYGLDFLNILLTRAVEESGITGEYLMLEKEYVSLFGKKDDNFYVGVDAKHAYNDIPPFISLLNTSLHKGIGLMLLILKKEYEPPSGEILYNGESMKTGTGSVMKSSKKYSARDHPYPSHSGQGRTGQNRTGQGRTGQGRTNWGRIGRGGGRRTRKYRRKTRTKKNLRKCKTHKKRKTRRGRK